MKKILLLMVFFTAFKTFAATYYISTTGNDTWSGTIGAPFKTITKANSVAVAGDIIYLRAGTHTYSAKVSLTKSGTAVNRITLMGYPGDARPLLDFSAMAIADANRGVQLNGSYWYIKGIDIYKAGDNGMHIAGAYNIIEFCTFFENGDTGLQLSDGAANNQIINCDSYYNKDAADGNADGFAVKLDVGTGNSFKGCRAWQNSDDGWDGLMSTGAAAVATTYDSCWCFMNGYLKAGTASAGNGNGFKMGGNNEVHDATLTRCLAAFNRVKGFDQNNNNGSMILYNCTGYKNKPNFGMNNNDPNTGKVMVVKNSVSLSGLSTDAFRTVCTRTNNSWQSPVTTTTADFVTVDSIGLRNPRKANGSLPDINFMLLANGSDLINAGVDVGLPYFGSAPDLGYAESNYPLPVKMLSFDAVIENPHVVLKWVTTNETNNKGWEIERATIDSKWQTIAYVEGRGNSTINQLYSYVDATIKPNVEYHYRLKQIDINGSYTYSNILAVKNKTGKQVQELNAYPNPTKSSSTVTFEVTAAQNVQLSLFNTEGKLAAPLFSSYLQQGVYSKQINLSNVAAGNYLLILQTATGKQVFSIAKF